MARSLVVSLILVLGCVACGGSDAAFDAAQTDSKAAASVDTDAESGTDVTNLGTAVPGDGSDPRRGPTTSSVEPVSGSDASGSDDEPEVSTTSMAPSTETTASIDLEGQGYRLAPAGSMPAELLLWDSDSVRKVGHDGVWTIIVDGPFEQVADVPGLGLVYQRPDAGKVIWVVTEGGERELIVGTGEELLTLEGVGVGEYGDWLIYYQKRLWGQPEDSVSTLRSYNVTSREVSEIVVTGGWESGSWFSFMTGRIVIAMQSAEGWESVRSLDLYTGEWLSDPAGAECFDGEGGCIAYSQVAVRDGEGIGFSSHWNEDGVVDETGLYTFDLDSGEQRFLVGFDWDNGSWYIEDLFILGDMAVMSLADSTGEPLPALVYDFSTGSSWTLPAAGFVRPAYLS